jgi:hypothetical protein
MEDKIHTFLVRGMVITLAQLVNIEQQNIAVNIKEFFERFREVSNIITFFNTIRRVQRQRLQYVVYEVEKHLLPYCHKHFRHEWAK